MGLPPEHLSEWDCPPRSRWRALGFFLLVLALAGLALTGFYDLMMRLSELVYGAVS